MNKIIFSLFCFYCLANIVFAQSDSLIVQDTYGNEKIIHVKVVYDQENDQIVFDRTVKWWIYNEFGGIVATGTSSATTMLSGESGTYYLFFVDPPHKENGALDFDNLPKPTYIIVLTREKKKPDNDR